MRHIMLALSLACAIPAHAEPVTTANGCLTDAECEGIALPLTDRLAAFGRSIVANPCSVRNGECEERAESFGISRELLEALDACEESEGEDDDACAIVDDAMAKDGNPA